MKYAMHCLDHLGQRERRAELNLLHKAHIEKASSYGVTVLIAGPLLGSADENDRMGALYIVEAEHSSHALAFFQDDPFWLNSVWNPETLRLDGVKLSVNQYRQTVPAKVPGEPSNVTGADPAAHWLR